MSHINIITDTIYPKIAINLNLSIWNNKDELIKNMNKKIDNKIYKELWETISSGNTWTGTFINKRKDGNIFYEDAIIFPIKDYSGKIINYAAVKRDITSELELEQQLHQAQKLEAIGRLAGGIAHDFNNMLTVINGFAELILMELKPENLLRFVSNLLIPPPRVPIHITSLLSL